MVSVARERVGLLTAVLSAVSLALVFGAAGGVVPSSVVPSSPPWLLAAIPAVNAAISLVAIAVIAVGWRSVRRGDVRRHRRAMLAALALFGTFLGLYLYRLVALGGPTEFGGPEAVGLYVYYPLLAVHVLLAIVCVPLLYYVLLLAASHPVADLRDTRHARVGRVAASLWLVSFALGVVVYALLHLVY